MAVLTEASATSALAFNMSEELEELEELATDRVLSELNIVALAEPPEPETDYV